jgi:GTP cyclohydrolase I
MKRKFNNLKEGVRNSTPPFIVNEEFPVLIKAEDESARIHLQESLIRQMQYIGEDTAREGLIDTPKRILNSWKTLYAGYQQKPEDILTVFASEGYNQIVLLKDIELYSMCEHHMLPFYGKAHIAYIPDKKVIGISKLARLLDIYARRMQIQERIGDQVTSALMEHLKPLGAACIIEASHMCMRMRGVAKQNSVMITSSMKGVFLENSKTKEELLNLIK